MYKSLLSTDEYLALYKEHYDKLFNNGAMPTMKDFSELNVLIFLGSEKQDILVQEMLNELMQETKIKCILTIT